MTTADLIREFRDSRKEIRPGECAPFGPYEVFRPDGTGRFAKHYCIRRPAAGEYLWPDGAWRPHHVLLKAIVGPYDHCFCKTLNEAIGRLLAVVLDTEGG